MQYILGALFIIIVIAVAFWLLVAVLHYGSIVIIAGIIIYFIYSLVKNRRINGITAGVISIIIFSLVYWGTGILIAKHWNSDDQTNVSEKKVTPVTRVSPVSKKEKKKLSEYEVALAHIPESIPENTVVIDEETGICYKQDSVGIYYEKDNQWILLRGITKKEKTNCIIGANKTEIRNMFSDWEYDPLYEANVDPNALKFETWNVIAVIDFNSKGIAEGVSFLSSGDEMGDPQTGRNSYVDKHWNELIAWATGGTKCKVERDTAYQYPEEIYIGNVHE